MAIHSPLLIGFYGLRRLNLRNRNDEGFDEEREKEKKKGGAAGLRPDQRFRAKNPVGLGAHPNPPLVTSSKKTCCSNRPTSLSSNQPQGRRWLVALQSFYIFKETYTIYIFSFYFYVHWIIWWVQFLFFFFSLSLHLGAEFIISVLNTKSRGRSSPGLFDHR
jgi:hypothetical protein